MGWPRSEMAPPALEPCGLRAAPTSRIRRGWVLGQLAIDGTWEHGVDVLTIAGRPLQARRSYEEGRLVLHGRREDGEFRVARELLGDDFVVTASPGDGGPTMRISRKGLE